MAADRLSSNITVGGRIIIQPKSLRAYCSEEKGGEVTLLARVPEGIATFRVPRKEISSYSADGIDHPGNFVVPERYAPEIISLKSPRYNLTDRMLRGAKI